jgi:hypothetical protein
VLDSFLAGLQDMYATQCLKAGQQSYDGGVPKLRQIPEVAAAVKAAYAKLTHKGIV